MLVPIVIERLWWTDCCTRVMHRSDGHDNESEKWVTQTVKEEDRYDRNASAARTLARASRLRASLSACACLVCQLLSRNAIVSLKCTCVADCCQ